VAGITGERTQLPPELAENVAWLREQTKLPICIGFGVSQPEHVKLLAPVADGLIVGSAIVRRVAAASTRPRSEVLAEVAEYVRTLADALRGVGAAARSAALYRSAQGASSVSPLRSKQFCGFPNLLRPCLPRYDLSREVTAAPLLHPTHASRNWAGGVE
jgi:hypothetical protein